MMKSQIAFLSLVAGALAGVFDRAACNADNCARAITGTRYAASVQAQHTADCSSFMIQTITPAAPTTTTTITGTSYSVIGSNSKRTAAPVPVRRDAIVERDGSFDALLMPPTVTARAEGSPAEVAARQVTQNPSNVPLYASACSGTARYSSACSCAGITMTTVYAPTPATVTSTSYAQQSVIPVCDPATNYGLDYLGGFIQAGVGLAIVEEGAISEQACCAACFPEGSSCFVYRYYNGDCSLIVETSGSQPPTDYCPYGVFTISNHGSGSYYGLGPCAVFA